ncbi:Mortality factor 4-like protein 1 [Trichoplax sp. H2]|nr:Mortality factor 4-like protein 1 [Trichoplax sp. H2]|eukprot:RDD39612.1 Mortality factor 4-like protein 1 [Trichoplax sp. H2]
MADTGKPMFADSERVLCYHGPLLYESKCIKFEIDDNNGKMKYLIHYNGWNKNWDEWVPEDRVLKYNDENLQLQKDLKLRYPNVRRTRKKMGEKEKGASTPSAIDKATSRVEPTRRKRGRNEQSIESEDGVTAKGEIKIKLPEEMKRWLIDDYDFINRQKRLIKLPRKFAVDDILDSYIKEKRGSPAAVSGLAREITLGLRTYFNSMLGSQLLYKFERPQYAEILKTNSKDTSLSQIYGAEHLLRLFVKLGNVMTYTTLDEKNINLVQHFVDDILMYIHRNESTFLTSEYETAPPEYNRKLI